MMACDEMLPLIGLSARWIAGESAPAIFLPKRLQLGNDYV